MTVRKPVEKRSHPIALAIVAGSGAMLLAAWLTSSVAVGWAVFVVVGVTTGLTVRKLSSGSSATRHADTDTVPATTRTVVPRPVEILNERFAQISALYMDARHTSTPDVAARSAVRGALDQDVRDEVLAYYDGRRDNAYGDGSGAAVREALVDKLESLHVQEQGPALVA